MFAAINLESGVASTRGRPSLVDDEGRDTRERLLRAASAACVEQGFEGARLSDIAARAGVSTPAVYNYFDSKDQLMYASAHQYVEDIRYVASESAEDLIGFFLSEDTTHTRRFLLELSSARNRHAEIDTLLTRLLNEVVDDWVSTRGIGRPRAKARMLVLFGMLGLETCSGIKADEAELSKLLLEAVEQLS